MVKIRLFRIGKRGTPFYRIVVTDARTPRNGRYIEQLGWYDPRGKELRIELGKVRDWIKKGAKPTAPVAKLLTWKSR